MSFTSEQFKNRLSALASVSSPKRYVVAFSGGLDSTVLLHALAAVVADGDVPVVAIHVRHDLHEDAGKWEAHCCGVVTEFAIDFESVTVIVDRESGLGLEAAARQARYEALRQRIQAGDWLLSADAFG